MLQKCNRNTHTTSNVMNRVKWPAHFKWKWPRPSSRTWKDEMGYQSEQRQKCNSHSSRGWNIASGAELLHSTEETQIVVYVLHNKHANHIWEKFQKYFFLYLPEKCYGNLAIHKLLLLANGSSILVSLFDLTVPVSQKCDSSFCKNKKKADSNHGYWMTFSNLKE